MALSSALNNALSGLTVTGRLAETTSNNLANAQTEGYGKRELSLLPGELGGVRVGAALRQESVRLIADRRLADADVAQRQSGATVLADVEQAFGTVGDPQALAGRLAAFEQSLITAGGDPASDIRLRAVGARAEDVVTTIQQDAATLQDQRQQADQAIARDIETLNDALQQMAELNADISRMRNSGQDPSPVQDARHLVIDKIAQITPIRVIDRGNDQLAIYTTQGVGLIDGKPAEIAFTPTATIVPSMTFAGGALSGVSVNGLPVSSINGFGGLAAGSLEASFTLRDQTLPALQTKLDAVAGALIQQYESTATDPTVTPGDPGLFTDNGAAFNPLSLAGLATRISVNAAVNPARGGDLSRLRDGVNAAAPGPIGNAAQLDRFLQGLRTATSIAPGAVARTIAGHAADLTADISDQRLYAEENLSFVRARQDALKTAERAQGVDTDLELQNLLRIEQAYAANARVIATVETMLQRLLEI